MVQGTLLGRELIVYTGMIDYTRCEHVGVHKLKSRPSFWEMYVFTIQK